jgi:dTDP-glucose 4,6-dehydratase
VTFEDGLRMTLDWYADHATWMDEVTSGDYQGYYERMYGGR